MGAQSLTLQPRNRMFQRLAERKVEKIRFDDKQNLPNLRNTKKKIQQYIYINIGTFNF